MIFFFELGVWGLKTVLSGWFGRFWKTRSLCIDFFYKLHSKFCHNSYIRIIVYTLFYTGKVFGFFLLNKIKATSILISLHLDQLIKQ